MLLMAVQTVFKINEECFGEASRLHPKGDFCDDFTLT